MFLKNLLVPSLFAKTNKNLEQHDGISSVLWEWMQNLLDSLLQKKYN